MPEVETIPSSPVSEGELHLLLTELEDERTRLRMREAFWISLVAHLVAIMLLATAPHWMPRGMLVAVTPAESLRDRQLTFLQLPKDLQRVSPPHNSKYISDKNRIAMSRTPAIDRKTLQELRDSELRTPGVPKPAAPAPPPGNSGEQQQAKTQAPPKPQPPQQPANQLARLEPPPVMGTKGAFGGITGGPGSAIQQAARALARSRAAGVEGAAESGLPGDYGNRSGNFGGIQGKLDILSDTMGVDFGPYLARVLHDVRENWYNLIPEVARPPIMEKGKVSIEFAIMKDGSVRGMRLDAPSGDVALDRAAWGGITASNPFPPLPNQFRGDYLALRFHFYYNPDTNELR